MPETWSKDGYEVSTDPDRLSLPVVHGFLRTAYWSQEIPRDTLERAVAGSLNFGLYRREEQIGYARVVTDKATFAWLCDVFVLEPSRGQGLGRWLVACVLAHPALQGLRRWMLATADAHSLYRDFGFEVPEDPGFLMARRVKDIYKTAAR
ncbi:GNAT family N-acetyltransferase [Pelagibius litoralis]|uniref:GNAT family N-acetyltransferase n=1 Tax=Pelagibius litoralis TaxID=374515 RepID=A0A967C3S1_9PROT|nr:GNAT family N-acetyltransferase [Pelagibius litoralis]NIA67755.1 GNAT family N-acetyltransferase [Pelagibius litoralis]